MLNVILYPWSDCAIYSGHFIEISTEVEKSHWHHVVSVTLTSKRCNFKIKPQICISTWVLLNIKCFGCPWIFFWGIHGWHDVSVTCCQHEFVSKGCFKLNHLLVHVSIHNNNWSKCLLKLKSPIWKIWCQCDALYQKFANCPEPYWVLLGPSGSIFTDFTGPSWALMGLTTVGVIRNETLVFVNFSA